MTRLSRPGEAGRSPPVTVAHQADVGLGLAALIIAAWATLHVASIFLVDWSGRTWALAPAVVLAQCWLSVGLFIVAHDAMHGSLAPGRARMNRMVGSLCVFLYAGFSYDRLHDSHHAHHRHPGTAEDPDFDEAHPERFWPWYLAFFRHYFGWREFAMLTLAIVVYVAVLGADVARLLLFWAAPALLSSLQLFYFGTYRPHRIEAGETFGDRHRARSDAFPAPVSLLTCFHFGYHHEHHAMPWLPWWRLPEARGVSNAGQGRS